MQEGGGCGPLNPGRQQVFPVCRRQAWGFSPVLIYPPTPSWHLFGKAGNTNLSYSVRFSSSCLPFSSAGDSIVFLFCTSGFSQLVTLTRIFSFPAVHKALNSSQPQAGGASLLLGRHLGKNPHKLSTHLPCLESGSPFPGPRVRSLSNKNCLTHQTKNIPLLFPEAKPSKLPRRRGRGNIQNYLWWAF